MNTAFTKTERFISGIIFALIPAMAFFYMGYYFWAYPIGGFLAGIIVAPAIVNPNQFLKVRSFAAGCLTLLASSLFTSFLISIRGAVDMVQGLSLNWEDITFSYISNWFNSMLTVTLFSLFTTIPYSLIYGPAGMLLSYFLYRFRQKNVPPTISDTFT